MATLLRGTRDAVVRVWLALQVELHGSYSIQRLAMLSKYRAETPRRHTFGPALLTPLPCILIVLLLDLPRLSRPGDGLEGSQVFWARVSMTTALTAFLMVEQMRSFLPGLTIRRIESVSIALAVTVCSWGGSVGLAMLIGFPIPLMGSTTSICFLIPYNVAVFLLYGKRIYGSDTLRKQFADYCRVVQAQWTLTFVYPAFNFGFQNLSSTGQTLIAVVLPLIKMAMKYLLAAMMEDMQDMKPEFVIFNVEVFHSLFVACCMQTSTSSFTTIILMTMDTLHTWLAIHDVNLQLDALVTTLQPASSRQAQNMAPALIDSAVYLLRDRATLEAAARMGSLSVTKERAASNAVLFRSPRVSMNAVAPSEIIPTAPPNRLVSSPRCDEVGQQAVVERALAECTVHLAPSDIAVLDSLPLEKRVLYVRQVLALLHMTEFILLIEYVEVIIPVIYSIYLVVVFNLSNRKYYPQLRNMTSSQLGRVVQSELIYATLELISFFVLDWILRAKVKFRPARQLSFVLGYHWEMVQAKLVLWLMLTVQSTLAHVGNDYTFRFQWLHNTTYFD